MPKCGNSRHDSLHWLPTAGQPQVAAMWRRGYLQYCAVCTHVSLQACVGVAVDFPCQRYYCSVYEISCNVAVFVVVWQN